MALANLGNHTTLSLAALYFTCNAPGVLRKVRRRNVADILIPIIIQIVISYTRRLVYGKVMISIHHA